METNELVLLPLTSGSVVALPQLGRIALLVGHPETAEEHAPEVSHRMGLMPSTARQLAAHLLQAAAEVEQSIPLPQVGTAQ
jgi:hypothetical protein